MSDPWKDHQEMTALYAGASADYEAALMSGDPDKIRVADEALTEADRLYSASLTTVVAADKRARALRREIPPFTTILAHPWTQIPRHLEGLSADTGHTSRHIHEDCGHPWDVHLAVVGGCSMCSCKAHPPNQPEGTRT